MIVNASFQVPTFTISLPVMLSDTAQSITEQLLINIFNDPPELLATLENQTVYGGSELTFSIPAARDPEGNQVTIEFLTNCSYCTFDWQNLSFHVTPMVQDSPATLNMALGLFDGANLAIKNFFIFVLKPYDPPVAKTNTGPPRFTSFLQQ